MTYIPPTATLGTPEYTKQLQDRLATMNTPTNTTVVNPHDQVGYDPTKDPASKLYVPTVSAPRTPGLLADVKTAAIATKESQDAIQQSADLQAANMRQARIDSINATFAPKIEEEQKAAADRLSRISALNFNAGIVGSGIDTAKVDEQKLANKHVMDKIQAEQAMLIQGAFDKADEMARERASTMTSNAKLVAEGNVTKYQQQNDKANEALKLFGAAGKTLEEIKSADINTYNTLKDVGGLSDFQMTSILNAANPKVNAKLEFKDGVVYQYYADPSGQVHISSQKAPDGVPPNYKAQFAPDGTLLYVPDKFDPTKPFSEQIITGGKYAKPESPTSFIKLSDSKKLGLSSMGFDPASITALQTFLQSNTVDTAIGNMQSGGKELTPAQKSQMKAILTGSESSGG